MVPSILIVCPKVFLFLLAGPHCFLLVLLCPVSCLVLPAALSAPASFDVRLLGSEIPTSWINWRLLPPDLLHLDPHWVNLAL